MRALPGHPGEVVDYLIDIFPVGRVFLPGHELVVKVHAPPLDDTVSSARRRSRCVKGAAR
jgi:hypothetical protein